MAYDGKHLIEHVIMRLQKKNKLFYDSAIVSEIEGLSHHELTEILTFDSVINSHKKTKDVIEFYIVNDKPELNFHEGIGRMVQTLSDSKWCLEINQVFELDQRPMSNI